METMYTRIAKDIERKIQLGVFQPGKRLPSLRNISRLYNVSKNTAIAALNALETSGLVVCYPQSGFYVLGGIMPSEGPEIDLQRIPERQMIISDLLHALSRKDLINLGAAVPPSELLPINRLNILVKKNCELPPDTL